MVEIRTYEGDGGDVARLLDEVWTPEYQDATPAALWDDRLIEWQLLGERDEDREFLVAAYDGSRLVGALFAEPWTFRLHGEEVPGTVGRLLTVHPEFRSQLVAFQLLVEFRRRHLEGGRRLCVGYALGGTVSPSGAFWTGMEKAMPGLTTNLGAIGYLVRLIDHAAVARWSRSTPERWGARLLSFVQGSPKSALGASGVRDYREADLPDCLRLVRGFSGRVDLDYAWTEERLARQLNHRGVPRTLVAEEAGRVGGLFNYYGLECRANGVMRIGVVDLVVVEGLGRKTSRSLIQAGLARMREDGIGMALLLRNAAAPLGPLMGAGFAPVPTNHSLVALRIDPTINVSRVKRFDIKYR